MQMVIMSVGTMNGRVIVKKQHLKNGSLDFIPKPNRITNVQLLPSAPYLPILWWVQLSFLLCIND